MRVYTSLKSYPFEPFPLELQPFTPLNADIYDSRHNLLNLIPLILASFRDYKSLKFQPFEPLPLGVWPDLKF